MVYGKWQYHKSPLRVLTRVLERSAPFFVVPFAPFENAEITQKIFSYPPRLFFDRVFFVEGLQLNKMPRSLLSLRKAGPQLLSFF
jgi:hypothetical protein